MNQLILISFLDQANTGGSIAGEPVNEQSGTTPTPSEVPENVQVNSI